MKTLVLCLVVLVVAINAAVLPEEADKDVEEVSKKKYTYNPSHVTWTEDIILKVLQKTYFIFRTTLLKDQYIARLVSVPMQLVVVVPFISLQ